MLARSESPLTRPPALEERTGRSTERGGVAQHGKTSRRAPSRREKALAPLLRTPLAGGTRVAQPEDRERRRQGLSWPGCQTRLSVSRASAPHVAASTHPLAAAALPSGYSRPSGKLN